mgnify:CR=1 FL=1
MPTKMSPKKYLNTLGLIDVRQIVFTKIEAHLHLENFGTEEISMDVRNKVEFQVEEKQGGLIALDKYKFLGNTKNGSVFEIDLHIAAIVSTKMALNEEFFKVFEQNTLKVITYPYVRQEVQDLTAKMGLSPLSLPIWRVPSRAKKEYLKPSPADRTKQAHPRRQVTGSS